MLTTEPSSDHSPSWSSDGRKLAFISNRTGDADVWLADLDATSSRFTNLSNTPRAAEAHPTWQGDGSRLAWASRPQSPGSLGIYVMDLTRTIRAAVWLGNGAWPAWDSDGMRLAALQETPTQQLLGAYDLSGTPLILPVVLPGMVRGLAWPSQPLTTPLSNVFVDAAQVTPGVRETQIVATSADVPAGRWYVVPLENVQLESAGLHAMVEPSFRELRQRTIADTISLRTPSTS